MTENVLVTSAHGEIGAAIIAALAEGGASVVGASRGAKRSFHGEYVGGLDFGSAELIRRFCDKNAEQLKDITSLVLIPPRIKQSEQALPTAEEWNDTLTSNFVGPLELVRVLVGNTISNDWSLKHVVTISGFTNVQVMGKYAQNSAIRLAMLGAFKSASHAYGPSGVKFNTISLGGLQTQKFDETVQERANASGRTVEQQYAVEFSNVPLRSYTSLESVGKLVQFVLSPDCAGMTGHNFIVDNGFTSTY